MDFKGKNIGLILLLYSGIFLQGIGKTKKNFRIISAPRRLEPVTWNTSQKRIALYCLVRKILEEVVMACFTYCYTVRGLRSSRRWERCSEM
jgi:hypothetical protein